MDALITSKITDNTTDNQTKLFETKTPEMATRVPRATVGSYSMKYFLYRWEKYSYDVTRTFLHHFFNSDILQGA